MSDRGALNLIDGEVVVPALTLGRLEDPSTGTPAGEMRSTHAGDVERALDAADRAWGHGDGAFSTRGIGDRLAALRRLGDALDERADDFAHLHARETGIPIAVSRLFAAGLGGIARGVAQLAPPVVAGRRLDAGPRRVEALRLPWGPAALYAAWNAAAFLATTKLSYAIAAGCPAILKPSEYAPATTGLLVEALQAAELGWGAVQVVCGGAEVGAALAADRRVRMISYTGGTAGGRAVAAASIGRMAALQLELSASNPAIVAPRADLQEAAEELARGALVLNGQWCEAPRRVFVHRADHDELVARILGELGRGRIGPALEDSTDIGPLAHRTHRDSVAQDVERLGQIGEVARSHDQLPPEGLFLSPTVVAGLPTGAVRGEIFGPVLAVSPYAGLEEALQAANALDDGLAGYVFASDPDEAFGIGLRLHAGEVRLGGVRVLDLADGSAQSFWGTSGTGGHGRASVLAAHLGTRIVGEEDRSLAL
ncbi:aldehyde dehydrogenase [Baekduia soli]|uniref:Aldehyde dehydrogenase n=1 Tax=Baekduia soli TaxID=496014 RepID=A0A5B8U043_9ACTN|nr:aldehyde dehydrogenase [Baekduia soli]QEC46359.1 aldehyde dehydrogenase [Baekduia soli]